MGAGRLVCIYQNLEEAISEERFTSVLELYQLIVEQCIEYKQYQKIIRDEYLKKPPSSPQSPSNIGLLDGYTISY